MYGWRLISIAMKRRVWSVVDEGGRLVVDRVYHGFDQSVQQQIKDYLNPLQQKEPVQQELPSRQNGIPFGADVLSDSNQKKRFLKIGRSIWKMVNISAVSKVGKSRIIVLLMGIKTTVKRKLAGSPF